MLHIILLILKIIGIVLLSVIGLILLAILCVLFVPVRYRVRVNREAGDGKPPADVYVKVTWLLHLVNILVRYPAEVTVRARISLFTVFRMPPRERRHGKKPPEPKRQLRRESQSEPEKPSVEAAGKDDGAESSEAISTETVESQSPETAAEPKAVPGTYEPYQAFDEGTMPSEETDREEVETPESASGLGRIAAVFSKCRQAIEKIKGLFQNIRYTIRKICDKIKSVLDNIQYYCEVIASEPFRGALGLCGQELMRILRMLKPAGFEADVVVGMKDPAATGQILAVYGMLYPLIGQHVRVAGDFDCEDMRIEGRLYLRGKVRVFTLLRAAIRIYFNRDIKQLIRLLKKEDA